MFPDRVGVFWPCYNNASTRATNEADDLNRLSAMPAKLWHLGAQQRLIVCNYGHVEARECRQSRQTFLDMSVSVNELTKHLRCRLMELQQMSTYRRLKASARPRILGPAGGSSVSEPPFEALLLGS